MALKSYESVLTIDPYNKAARKGMEEIHNSELKYSDEAYNETRGRLLWQVEKAWERPARKSKVGRTAEATGRPQDTKSTDQIIAKLNTIIIPKIDLNDSPVSEAVEYLKQKSVEQDPAKKGVNIFLKLGVSAAPQPAAAAPASPFPTASISTTPVAPATEPHVTISLTHVPLYVALQYISSLSNLKLKIDPYAVSVVPLSEATDVMVTKEYQVPPTFIPTKAADNSNTTAPQVGTQVSAANLPRLGNRANAKDYLESQGVQFPQGSSANYISAGSKLVVRNTRDNIDLIDSLVDLAMGEAPSQVDIQTKFLEISQNNLQELGFDWLLGPFSIGGGVYGSGGGNSDPSATAYNSLNYPFGNPMAGGAPMSPVGSLRSGYQGIKGNSIDGLLAGQDAFNTAPAPGIFSIAGVFTDAQFQLVIRALNQKKGIDLMSAPKVTTKSGAKATVKIVNEFRYPRQYQPPQIPQSTSNTSGGSPPAITPAFPSDFTTENIGVTLDTTPTVGPDGYTIDLELNPKVTDFDGFINYGSPINSVGYSYTETLAGFLYTPKASTLTTNTINQPVFSTREVNTFVTVWDGQTVGLGGLIREETQKIQDKVPFLGDIPVAGRLFRSDADQKVKKNLVIFVTPKILDAEGQPRRGDTEEPEVVKPLGLPQDLPQPTVSAIRGK
jgi:general secretion pathway protein D